MSLSKCISQAILVVGYGTERNQQGIKTDFWLAQNSWGRDWGERGLIKIVRGKGICNIAIDAWSPVLKPPPETTLEEIYLPNICRRTGDILRSKKVEKSFCIVEKVSKFEVFNKFRIYFNLNRTRLIKNQKKVVKNTECECSK